MTTPFDRRTFLQASAATGIALGAGIGPARAEAAAADELATLTVAELTSRIRQKQVSAREITQAYMDRIAKLDGRSGINAYITVDREAALREAGRLDGLAARGQWAGPLHGVPVALKDNLDTAGLRTTGGSKVLESWVPREDANVVWRLKRAGAIVLGKTNLHEFAFGITNNNPHWGPTRNPYDPTRIPGGSSGGSGAAVAAGLCAAAIGTDTGGSVRIPAALCGVVGLKPTLGRVGRGGMMYLSFTRDVIGPITRSVRDAALLLRPMTGADPRDRDTLEEPMADLTRGLGPSLTGVRLGVPRKLFFEDNDPEVTRLIDAALDDLAKLGAHLVDVEVPALDEAFATGFAIVLPEAIYALEAYLRQVDPEATIDKVLPQFGPEVRAILGGQKGTPEAKPMPGYAYVEAINRKRPRVIDGFRHALRDVHALVAPTTPLAAARIGEDAETTLNGRQVNTFFTFIRDCDPISVAGLPAISVPAGFTSGGLPVGLQVVGHFWEEARVLQIAHAYEQATRHWRPPTLG